MTEHVPELSVVIASRDGAERLRRCLAGLSQQTIEHARFEVIVADDGSRDDTAKMLAAAELPFRLRHLALGRRGVSAARNAGIAAAAGRVCVFLDDDVRPSPGLLEAHARAHRDESEIIGIGRLIQQPPRGRDWYARAFAQARDRHYDRLAEREPRWTDCHTGNLSVARDALLEVGGFSESAPVSVDNELAFRLTRRGLRAVYVPDARGVHDDDKRRPRLLEDARRQGAGHVALADAEPAMAPALLGWYGAAGGRELTLRRLLIATRLDPEVIASLGAVMPSARWRARWLNFVSRLTFWRAVRGAVSRSRWRSLTRGVPVLMYHAFAQQTRGQRYIVSARTFRRQMRLLALLRYRVIALEDLARMLREHELPPRTVAITIDDGYRDNLEIAAPVLARRGYPATLFLVSRRIGGRCDWDRDPASELAGRELLGVDDTRRMALAGIAFGAHTQTHPVLPEASDETLAREVAESRRELEQTLGTPVPLFSYPYGRHDGRAVDAARASYLGACTTDPRLVRPDDDPFLIPRIEVHGTDSLLRFLRKLSVGGA